MTDLPAALDHLDELAPLVDVPRLGLMVDFDGTLAPIAPTPDEAVISPAAFDALRRIAPAIEMVCLISGRALADLTARVDLPGATFVGSHGVEFLDAGGLRVEPGAADYRETVAGVLEHLRSRVDDPGFVWQSKSLGASVHFRRARDPKDAARRLEAALADAPGADRLESFWGKMVLELVAPLGLDKGHAVRKLAHERRLTRCCSSATTRRTQPGWRRFGSSDRRAYSEARPSPSSTTTLRRPYCSPRTTRCRAFRAWSYSWPGSRTGSRAPASRRLPSRLRPVRWAASTRAALRTIRPWRGRTPRRRWPRTRRRDP